MGKQLTVFHGTLFFPNVLALACPRIVSNINVFKTLDVVCP